MISTTRNKLKMNHELMFDQMDKASIIKDAIDYIQELHNQERVIQAEI